MEEQSITIKLDFIKETVCCIDCGKETNNINQIRKVKIRDMPIQGKITVLEMGRRQY